MTFKKVIAAVAAVTISLANIYSGVYSPLIGNIDAVNAETYAETVLQGDISGNGEIDIIDAIIIAKFLLHPETLDAEQQKIADYDDSGKTDILDAIGIAKYLLKASSSNTNTSTGTEHVHTWKNVYNTVDVYEEQPIYEEVPIYEEQIVREYHDIITNTTNKDAIGYDLTEGYRKYVESGGTEPRDIWGYFIVTEELGILTYAHGDRPVLVKKQVQVGTEKVQTGTETVKTTKQEYDHKVCITCGEEQ